MGKKHYYHILNHMIYLILTSFLFLNPVSKAISGVEWCIELVDTPKTFYELTDRSLRLDSAGHPHVVYGGNRLYYAWHDGNVWNYDTVDSTPGVGAYASLALDSSNKAHVAYIDYPTESLKYAFQDGPDWQVEVVDSPVEDHFVSLDIDTLGFAHIAYISGQKLKHAFQTDDGGQIETVDGSSSLKGYPSLAISEDDIIHISYLKYFDLYHAKKQDGIWQITEVDPTPGSSGGFFTSIALDNEGQPHVSHIEGDSGGFIQHSYWNQNTWITEELEYIGEHSYYNSMAVDGFGYAHLAYYHSDTQGYWLRYAHQDHIGWQFQNIDLTRGFISIDVNPTGFVHFCYIDYNTQSLKHSYKDMTGLHFEDIDEGTFVGTYNCLVIDNENFSQISYVDSTNGDLKFAYQDQSGWHIEVVDSEGDIKGSSTSLALDSTWEPHICYYDYTNKDLKYAVKEDGSWIIMIVDHEGDVGTNASLALDNHNKAKISYCDQTNRTLKLASEHTKGWDIEVVDSGIISAGNTCLVLDKQGYPNISYCYAYSERSDHELRYAFQDSEGWHIEVVDTEGNLGQFNSMTIDNEGIVHVSYNESGSGDLKYAKRNLQGWHTEFVDSLHRTGEYNSIITDDDNLPHIAYRDNYLGVLKHACFSGSSWELETIDDRASPGYFTSIAIDAEDLVRISYGDGYCRDLKHAFLHNPQPTNTPTPTCPGSGITLFMPSHLFCASDECWLTAMICNRNPAPWESHVFFCVLAYAGSYWYFPDWTTEFNGEIIEYIPLGLTAHVVIEPFIWPPDTGTASGLLFLSVITDPAMSEIIGTVGEWEFGWTE